MLDLEKTETSTDKETPNKSSSGHINIGGNGIHHICSYKALFLDARVACIKQDLENMLKRTVVSEQEDRDEGRCKLATVPPLPAHSALSYLPVGEHLKLFINQWQDITQDNRVL